MENLTWVIGHKNPDTDSICSALAYAALKNEVTMEGFVAGRLGDVSPETQFVLDHFGVNAPELLADGKDKMLILVDHNEVAQSVDNLNEGVIKEIIDHHKIGDVQTKEPILFRNMPLGCTATIIYMNYLEYDVKPAPAIAGLLCSAILSDTLAFRSPTCTKMDKMAAEELAGIAGIEDIQAYAKDMFAAGSNLAEKTEKEIFYLDFKKFTAGNTTYGVGQVTSMNADELAALKGRMEKYMQDTFAEHEADMLFFMLTDILEEGSELLCVGEGAVETAKAAFHPESTDRVYLPGAVSRKKQIIPQLTEVLEAK
ncbi:MAG: putative manganese-dependent inorganic diphosphatase [Peptococcaceae bacterium]|nr:putative manganese-dependent inorganic diphosphatase [Peptococcaceae bacterium]